MRRPQSFRARSRKRIVEALTLLNGPPEKPDALHEVVSDAVTELGRVEVERRLRSALGKMDQAPILTIHGFCQRLLQEHPLLFGIDFDFELTEDASAIHAELAVDFWTSELYDKPEWLLQALQRGSVGPDYLAALANQTLLADTEILGPERRDYDPTTMTRFLESLQRAAQIWARQRDQIVEGSVEHQGLAQGLVQPEIDRREVDSRTRGILLGGSLQLPAGVLSPSRPGQDADDQGQR